MYLVCRDAHKGHALGLLAEACRWEQSLGNPDFPEAREERQISFLVSPVTGVRKPMWGASIEIPAHNSVPVWLRDEALRAWGRLADLAVARPPG